MIDCVDPGDLATLLGAALVATEGVLAARRAYAIDPAETSLAARLTGRLRAIEPVQVPRPPAPPRSADDRAHDMRRRRHAQARKARQAGYAPTSVDADAALARRDADVTEANSAYVQAVGQWHDRMHRYQQDRDRHHRRDRAAILRPTWRLWVGLAATVGGVLAPTVCG